MVFSKVVQLAMLATLIFPRGACIMGLVELEGLTDGSAVDLPSQQWTYQIGLKGKALGLETDGLSLWVSGSPKSQPLTWYKTSPEWGKAGRGSTVKALDVIGLLILLQLAVAHIYYEGRNVVIDFVN
ncbi:hypothetical protein L1987_48400 [Smallanthus sonchifolius]|uniref:Uncharacterized protein n=1 Tax=Smallanthus sonchifolius TaxID=185202 RepID=A0ACB9FSY7_9ASTR|nr:hypothetical protein L1987_48400 [Smallanthus sonchifolius]